MSKAVWLSMKYEIPPMLDQGGGAIVNCSLVAGVIGFPGIGIYVASKHAVIGLTKTAALEYSARGIRINAVNPAVIDTEMVDRLADGMKMKKDDLTKFHPIGRLGRVEEVAEAVLWLCSDKASFVTGHSPLSTADSPPSDAKQRFENLQGRFVWIKSRAGVDVDLDLPTPGLSFFGTR
jgi:NAD(P)-dependent dehydrogenase (short-subunit alcohol dehydrogenase family)